MGPGSWFQISSFCPFCPAVHFCLWISIGGSCWHVLFLFHFCKVLNFSFLVPTFSLLLCFQEVPPLLLRYNWHIALYQSQVYHVMIWYLYILQNNHPNKSSWHPSLHILTKYFSCDKNFLRFTQLSSMQHSIVNYSHSAVHHISRIYLFYNWKFVPLTSFTISPTLHSCLWRPSLHSLFLWAWCGFFGFPYTHIGGITSAVRPDSPGEA